MASIDYEISITEEDLRRMINWGFIVFQKVDSTAEDTFLIRKLEILINQLQRDKALEKTQDDDD